MTLHLRGQMPCNSIFQQIDYILEQYTNTKNKAFSDLDGE